MSHLDIHQFMCRADNYGVLIHDPRSGATAAIDAPDAAVIERELARRGWQLTHIFITHHHEDHVTGNEALKRQFGCVIVGPAAEKDRIPAIDRTVQPSDTFQWAGREIRILGCTGHTKGHIAYHIPSEYCLFAGDTLFAMGCGRVFEGTLAEMWQSLDQFRKLPPTTFVYCGHEYTEANARFAVSVEPGNRALQQRAAIVSNQRAKGEMTCPTTIGEELKTNPFLRPDSAEIRQGLGLQEASEAEVFAELRRRKDSFKG